ncbi:uncharacterized protein LOC113329701 [Papaver somniferum]|uniref:uncharacterized protein LOC113329701 n=1 Tax=Papaver somniferum TaxID=3469 RepID=UPI000E6F4B56|nr:uncharacterized protein LOC113329701 [Papaver somniferum]
MAVQVLSGFGYDPRTNEYKVVRIVYTLNNHGEIQVYTLGSGNGWRNKGIVDSYFNSIYGVFANGALHWLDSSQKKIMAFNLSDENFHVLPAGPFLFPSYYQFLFLRSWGEPLYGVGTGHQCFDVWSLRSTLSLEGIANNTAATTYNEYGSWDWDTHSSGYSPFAVTKSGLVLMWHWDTLSGTNTLCYYDPATKSAMSLGGGLNNCLEVIPHMNSFVSLKDLGETKCKKRKKGISGVGVKDHQIHL